MDIEQLRKKIDSINSDILALFLERTRISSEIAQYKKENNIPILDEGREREILNSVKNKAGDCGEYASELFYEIMRLSKERQRELLYGKTGLLGEHLSHSYSVEIHKELGNNDYRLFECEPNNVHKFVKNGHFRALNVTIPYKKTVLPLCDTLSEAAKEIGCVNTMVFTEDGKINGYCTDAYGFTFAVKSSGIDVCGKKVLILGSGGASLAVKYALNKLGAGQIITVSRNGENNYNNLSAHTDAQILVNATPVGMFPDTNKKPIDLDLFPALTGVFDLIYNPLRTDLLAAAQKRGIACENGLAMLVAQAKRSAELFNGTQIPETEIYRILRLMNMKMRNIVLVGMPGCGKSAVGEELKLMTGRELVDTDAQIVQMTGKSIPEIFASEGESVFRAYERKIVKKTECLTGKIIVTGGGAVLSEENRRSLVKNSRVYNIMRAVDKLEKDGRPLSMTSDPEQLFLQREPLYEECCDAHIDNNSCSPSHAAADILADFTDFCK